MEVGVYDSLNRKVLITVALPAGVLAAFTMFLLLVFQLDFLFGLEVRRQRFSLSEFDRVSLSRGFRAGYAGRSGAGTEGLPYGEPANRVSLR